MSIYIMDKQIHHYLDSVILLSATEIGLVISALARGNLKCIIKSLSGQAQKHPYYLLSFYAMLKSRQKKSMVREFRAVIAFRDLGSGREETSEDYPG